MKITHRKEELSDRELLKSYKKTEDLRLLGILYKRYMPFVYGICLKYLKNREDSQDAVMQIFEQLIESLKKHDVENFKSWLHVTSRNFCLILLRKEKIHIPFEELSPQIMEYEEEEHHNYRTELEIDLIKLENCVEKLKGDQQQCVRLFYLKKRSYAEITELTGHSTKKVKSFIQNGKRNLKICLETND